MPLALWLFFLYPYKNATLIPILNSYSHWFFTFWWFDVVQKFPGPLQTISVFGIYAIINKCVYLYENVIFKSENYFIFQMVHVFAASI
jgi:ABC-type amino acid transport system permease subunit